jgi:transposase InsO family protein
MEACLVVKAFRRATTTRKPKRGLIVHSDGGGQYGAKGFRKHLIINGYKQSMTRKANHYDNSIAESLFSRFKAELLDGGKFQSLEDARAASFDYIDGYYNTIRKHSSIGYKNPLQFEREMGY